jgi:glucose/arabinose dehydrogenase
MKMRIVLCLLVSGLIGMGLLQAQPSNLTLQQFATNFNDPVDLTHAGDERIFVLEKGGTIQIMDQQGSHTLAPFLDISPIVNAFANERGLLGLAFHPDYKTNGYFYVNYNVGNGSTVIARYTVSATDPNVADPSSQMIVMTISQPYSNHNGGCIKFGPDGYLYIGMGDGGSAGDPGNRSQDGTELLGKMLRIDVDGGTPYGIPASNPYVGNASIEDEIWAIGLRNPWRFSFDRTTGDLWIGDVGQNAWEEIDYWAATNTAAPNFGWRCYEGNVTYNTSANCGAMSSYDYPVFVYSNNGSSNNGCSVTGGMVYRGPRYANLWGMYLFADYCSGRFWYTMPNGGGGWITNQFANLANFEFVGFGSDLYNQMYVMGINTGSIYKVADTTCTPVARIDGPSSVSTCDNASLSADYDPALGYQWLQSGSVIPGATSPDYTPTVSGTYSVIVSNGSCMDTSGTVTVTLIPAPSVQITGLDTFYCSNAPATIMSSNLPGGTYSGPGVTGSTFDPAAAGVGQHAIIYSFTDSNNGCTGYDTVNVRIDVCSGIQPADLLNQFRFYPNPVQRDFMVAFDINQATELKLSVLNSAGQVILERRDMLASGTHKLNMSLPQVANGLYFLQIETEAGKGVQKFMVRK